MDFSFKTFLIGKKGVGRSTFAKSPYFSNFMDDDLMTGLYSNIYDCSFDLNNKNKAVKLQIWSYNPESKFKNLFSLYITGSNGTLIMFDVSDLTSLNEIDNWMGVIRKKCKDIPVMLVGNKADLTEHLERSRTLADSIVKKYRLTGYYEMSAFESRSAELILITIAKTLVQKFFELNKAWKGQKAETKTKTKIK